MLFEPYVRCHILFKFVYELVYYKIASIAFIINAM